MPDFVHRSGGQSYRFADLKGLLAAASPRRSGDEAAGIAAASDQHRAAARRALAQQPLTLFLSETVIPYEQDEITRLIVDSHDRDAFAPVASLTVGGLRDWLLSDAADSGALTGLAPGLTAEMVAAVSKLMRNQDLIAVAAKCRVVTAFRSTIGLPGTLSSRLQPNHPTDDPLGVVGSVLEGLRNGIGDAVIGITPAGDRLAATVTLLDMLDGLRHRFDIPLQCCILADVATSLKAIGHRAPVDLLFQTIAGSESANRSLGVSLSVLAEAHDAARSLRRGTVGDNVLYFETGQGSATTAAVDQQTMEARAYAVARAFRPLLVNAVIDCGGRDRLHGSKQIVRAGLEDHFCGKLMGLPMGMDVGYTRDADADPDDMDSVAALLALAGVTFLVALPDADDRALTYQTLSYRDLLHLRQSLNRTPAPEFQAWLERMGMTLPATAAIPS